MDRFAKVALANRMVIALVSALIVGFGTLAGLSLRQELIPSIDTPGAYVVAVYPGAPALTVERDVTKPIEDAVRTVDGVSKVSSTSSSNGSEVHIEWGFESDTDRMEGKLRSAINEVSSRMPQGVQPVLAVGNADDRPVRVAAVKSDADTATLSQLLTDVAVPRLEALPGVREVKVLGAQQRQVTITLRGRDMDRYSVDPAQVQLALAPLQATIPGGSVALAGKYVQVQVGRTLSSVDQLRGVWVQGRTSPVRLSRIASVEEVPADAASISRVNGSPALTLYISKQPQANEIAVARALDAAMPSLAQDIGHDTIFTTVIDTSTYIEDSVRQLTTEGLIGLIMAVIVIALFLRTIGSTVITAVSIPLSLLIGLIGLYAADYTLNMLTLAGLTISIGRVVDDSIVVIENIRRHLSLGEPRGSATVVAAVREVASAVTASTITTVAVFAPMALVGGQVGALFRPFAITVTIALIASLVVALTVVPVLAFWLMRPVTRQLPKGAGPIGPPNAIEQQSTGLQRAYLPVLRFSLKHRLAILLAAVLLFGATLAGATQLKSNFLGELAQGVITLNQELAPGTTLAETDKANRAVEEILAAQPEVALYASTVGGMDWRATEYGGSEKANAATITVNLKPGFDGAAVKARLDQAFASQPQLGRISIDVGKEAGSGNATEVALSGADDQDLTEASDQVQAMMHNTAGLGDIRSDQATKQSVYQVDIKEDKAAHLGMNQSTVGLAVVKAIRGSRIATIVINDNPEYVVLKTDPASQSKTALEKLTLPITTKQITDERTDLANSISDDQLEQADRQFTKSLNRLNDQASLLRLSRAQTRAGLGDLLDQLNKLEKYQTPTTPEESAHAAETQRKYQIKLLRRQITRVRAQLNSVDDQLDTLASQRNDLQQQLAITVKLAKRARKAQTALPKTVRLGDVATVTTPTGQATIHRTDGTRTVTITASINNGDVGGTSAAVQKQLAQLPLPASVTSSMGGVSTDQATAFTQLALAMLVAIALVYLIMVATFRSLLQPLLLLISIPFAATGAVAALLITSTPLGIAAMIGLLMLIGIVVTNAIVLMDLINRYRTAGSTSHDAIIHGARLRLRPILMTALATITALTPMAMGLGGGGGIISKSLAIVVIGGLITSTILTLVLVPVLYSLAESARERLSRGRQHPAAQSEAGQPSPSTSSPLDRD